MMDIPVETTKNKDLPLPKTDLTKRLASPDILKALSIVAVVFIHGSAVIPFSPSNADFTQADISLAARALRFCVPVFIFLWAYFMEKSYSKQNKFDVMPKFIKLLIPFVFWSTVYFLLTANFKTLGLSTLISKHWTGYGWSGQYYFVILFQLLFLFPILHYIAHKLSRFVPLLFILSLAFYLLLSYSGWFYIGFIDKLNDRIFIYWIPYVILGIIYANKNIFKFSVPLLIAVILTVLVPLEIYWLKPKSTINYLLPTIFICTLLLISTMEAKLSYAQLPSWVSKLVHGLASQTLGIFCLNPLVILLLNPVFKSLHLSFQFPLASVIISLLSTAVIVSLCILIIKILKSIKLGFLAAN